MENTQEPVADGFTGAPRRTKRVKRLRTTEALQRYLEKQIHALDSMEPYLQPGQKGYVEGQDTPNPGYINSPTERMRIRLQCMNQLKSLLPIHEAEQHLEELEAKLMQILQLIEQRAPFLLSGAPDGFKTH